MYAYVYTYMYLDRDTSMRKTGPRCEAKYDQICMVLEVVLVMEVIEQMRFCSCRLVLLFLVCGGFAYPHVRANLVLEMVMTGLERQCCSPREVDDADDDGGLRRWKEPPEWNHVCIPAPRFNQLSYKKTKLMNPTGPCLSGSEKGRYRDYYRDPYPHSLLSTSQNILVAQALLSLRVQVLNHHKYTL